MDSLYLKVPTYPCLLALAAYAQSDAPAALVYGFLREIKSLKERNKFTVVIVRIELWLFLQATATSFAVIWTSYFIKLV